MKKYYIIGLLFGLLFTYLVFRGIDFQSFIDALRGAEYIYILPVALCSGAGIFFRAWRWQYFLRPIKHIPLGSVWSATVIGYMGMNVLPMRLGEFVRPYAVGMLGGISKSSALATVVLERILDLVCLMVFFAIVVLVVDLPEWFIMGGYMVVAAIVGIITFLFLLYYQEKRALTWINNILRWFPKTISEKAKDILSKFIKGLHVFKASENYVAIIILTFLMWLGYTLSVYYGFYAFNLVEKYDLNLFSALVIIVFTAVGLMIPSAPGGIGPFHYLCQEGMNLMGVSPGEAVGFAFFNHAVSFTLNSILGVAYLWKENLRLVDIRQGELNNEEGAQTDDDTPVHEN